MRISASRQRKFPLLASLLETAIDFLEDNPAVRDAAIEISGDGGRFQVALELGRNPWVTIDDVAGDIGGYSHRRPNTIVIDRGLAERVEAGGDTAAHNAAITAFLKGLLHWQLRADWSAPTDAPGADFAQLLANRGLSPGEPAAHEPTNTGIDTAPAVPPNDPPDTLVHRLGATILDVAKRHVGQDYRFEPTPYYDDPNWRGPFDCAEYASYCVFRAYRIAYGVGPHADKRFHSYSGFWRRDAIRHGIRIPWRRALDIPGAILLRYPPGRSPPYGHVAISLGNGGDTYEARGRRYGVVRHTALGRSWHTGVLIPGVLYDGPDGPGGNLLVFKAMDPPAGYSPIVEDIETRLADLDLLDQSQVNGVFDTATDASVRSFQGAQSLTVDGEVGPATGAALGMADIWENAPVEGNPNLAHPLPSGDTAPDTAPDAAPGAAPGTAIDTEILTLARTLFGEARGEPDDGAEAVANVILNRVKSPRYPNTVAKVCLQRRQFSCWNAGDPNLAVIRSLGPGADPRFDALLAVARLAVMGSLPNLVGAALHYHARSVAPSWVRNSPGATLVREIGNHLFWTGIR